MNIELLQAAGSRGEFESRLNSVICEIKASSKPIILIINAAYLLNALPIFGQPHVDSERPDSQP